MSTPQRQTIKGPRRSSRRAKNINTSVSEAEQSFTDSGPSPPDTGYVGAKNTGAHLQADGQYPRRKSQASRKTHGTPKPYRTSSHQQASPQRNTTHPSQRQGTPIKQAYAGPTFHSSPAPSALPMPSFYSKSMPSIPSTKPPDTVKESEAHEAAETEAEDSRATLTGGPKKRESTPLDFLFEAALQARGTPRAESPLSRSANLSAMEDSPVSRSPAPREGGETVFPFELDGNGSNTNSIGPAFATPYKERIVALRSSSASPSALPSTLDEDERRTKTEALKKMLLNDAKNSAPHPKSTSSDPNNPFSARAPDLRSSNSSSHLARHRSGPSTPDPSSHVSGPHQYFSGLPPTALGSRMNGSPMHRPATSHLRRQYQVQEHESPAELSSDNSATAPPISTARNTAKHPLSPYQSSNNSSIGLPHTGQTPNHSSSHSAQQLENDLRRVLKLNITSKG